MSKKMDDHDFLNNVKSLLDERCDQMDAATLSRLRRSRHMALRRKEDRIHGLVQKLYSPAAGLAALSLAILISILLLKSPHLSAPGDMLGDVEILAAGENLDFIVELDFFIWLEEEGIAG